MTKLYASVTTSSPYVADQEVAVNGKLPNTADKVCRPAVSDLGKDPAVISSTSSKWIAEPVHNSASVNPAERLSDASLDSECDQSGKAAFGADSASEHICEGSEEEDTNSRGGAATASSPTLNTCTAETGLALSSLSLQGIPQEQLTLLQQEHPTQSAPAPESLPDPGICSALQPPCNSRCQPTLSKARPKTFVSRVTVSSRVHVRVCLWAVNLNDCTQGRVPASNWWAGSSHHNGRKR